ncbi:MAG: hypothetical protein C0520_04725 [Sphingopyxis sp.]|nr:hypothetical protein [Sphingopyxis sp.]
MESQSRLCCFAAKKIFRAAMLRNNSVLSEWIESPIQYRDAHLVIARMAELKDRHFDPNGFALHYAKLGRTSVARWLQDADEVSVRRYFYALRPALAIRVQRRDPSRRPPMQIAAADGRGGLAALGQRGDRAAGRVKGRHARGGTDCARARNRRADHRGTDARGRSARASAERGVRRRSERAVSGFGRRLMIIIDRSEGEGGEQVLRYACALSLITGEPFTIENIRGGREKPGPMRQHVTAIEAACVIGGAKCSGLAVGSNCISFRPGRNVHDGQA